MELYTCNICNKKFKRKANYVRHFERKYPCKKIPVFGNQDENSIRIDESDPMSDHFLSQVITNGIIFERKHSTKKSNYKNNNKKLEKINIECKYCHKKFNHKTNYYRHMRKYCKEKKIYEEKMKEEEKKKMEKEIGELKKKVDELKMSQHVTYNNITLIAHNKQPDLSHLTNNDYLKIMNRGFNSVPKLIEAIHFNPEKPENQNIYIPDIKNKYVMAWDGKEWNLRDRNNIIDDMYDDNSNILLEKMEELDEGSNKFKKFKRFINQYENNLVKNRIKEEIKLLLYNKNSLFK
jgi:hypothetical protein